MIQERCQAFVSDLEKCDTDILRGWFTEDATVWVPPAPPVAGNRRICALFRLIFRRYREIHWTVSEIHALSSHRGVFLTASWGTFIDGRPYKNDIVTFVEFDPSGKIVSLSDYFKDTAIFSALASETKSLEALKNSPISTAS